MMQHIDDARSVNPSSAVGGAAFSLDLKLLLDLARDFKLPSSFHLVAGRSAAWLARHTGGVEVAGSNPVGPTNERENWGEPAKWFDGAKRRWPAHRASRSEEQSSGNPVGPTNSVFQR